MCGLTGVLGPRGAVSEPELRHLAGTMAGALHHRGPDDDGAWVDAAAGIALGFRRLAVIDLTETGHQPMISADGRYVLVFNGELYNFGDLRHRLEAAGHVLRGTGDTEVLLESIARWGVEPVLREADAMFAFALWDRSDRTLTLARDRFGEKPLYFGWCGDTLVFGSELKALRRHPRFPTQLDPDSVALYLQHGWVPDSRSIHPGIAQVRPGTTVAFTADCPGQQRASVWWSLADVARDGATDRRAVDVDASAAELGERLLTSVRRRLVADVPVGAFLSGGLDSSTVVALMAEAGGDVRTFTIGFREAGYDEAGPAREVARLLGTDHEELYVTPAEARSVIQELPRIYDEPFADSSQIPTVLLARLTAGHVTVALSGDGGDEMLAGYDHHRFAQQRWGPVRRLLGPARTPAAAAARRIGGRAAVAGEILSITDPADLHRRLTTQWKRPSDVVRGSGGMSSGWAHPQTHPELREPLDAMRFLDQAGPLTDDILVKVDRAAMAASLETRLPFLAPAVVDLAWRLPPAALLDRLGGKRVLRTVLRRHLPADLVDRPKAGFAVPIGDWLRGPLRSWAEDLLDPTALARDGLLEPAPIRELWAQHLAGAERGYHLWNVLVLQCWRDARGTG